MELQHQKAVDQLSQFENREISILRLAEPILSAASGDSQKRASDASTDARENPSPASLDDDLTHYKELFSKLRFSYIEQVTKEKFLRAIVGEPPQIVEHQENVDLEQKLAIDKANLKAHKLAVAKMVEELEARGRNLAKQYERIQDHKEQLSRLPTENSALKGQANTLRAQYPGDSDSTLALPLRGTQNLLAARRSELEALEKRLRGLQQALPRKSQELELLENELRSLELQRAGTIAAAQEARQRHEEGERGRGDDLELKGRWYRNVDSTLSDIFQANA